MLPWRAVAVAVAVATAVATRPQAHGDWLPSCGVSVSGRHVRVLVLGVSTFCVVVAR